MREYRMADLVEEFGLSRSTIHRYIRMGLVPRPLGGRTRASVYTDLHRNSIAVVQRMLEKNRTLRDLSAEARQ